MLTLKESTLVLAKIRVHHGVGGGEALLHGQQHGLLVRFRRCERHRAQDAQRVEAL